MTIPPLTRSSLVAFGCGPKGAGKTRFLWRHFTKPHPRVLTLDVAHEALEHDPDAIETYGLEDTRQALKHCARNGRRWHVAAILEPAEVSPLLELLAPPARPGLPGFSRAVGGMALQCGEIQELVPNRGASREWQRAFSLSRHYLLSLLVASQRPSLCSRIVTSQADVIFSFFHHEPAEVQYLGLLAPAFREVVPELPPFHVAYFVKADRTVYVADERGRVYRKLDSRGRETPPEA